MRRSLIIWAVLTFGCACGSAPPPTDGGYGGDSGSTQDGGSGDDGGRSPDGGFKITHIVVIVKENHTFDSYFTGFPGADSSASATLSDGTSLVRPPAPPGGRPARDPSHSSACALKSYNDGGMNGFDLLPCGARTADGGVELTQFIQYAEADIPFYWAYARNFVLADHFFATQAGPSAPGHFATAMAQTPFFSNTLCDGGACAQAPRLSFGAGCWAPAGTSVLTYDEGTCSSTGLHPACFDVPTLVDDLPSGYTFRAYGPPDPGGSGEVISPFGMVQSIGGDAAKRATLVRPDNELIADLGSTSAPNLVYANLSGGCSEHPPNAVSPGERRTVEIVNAVMNGPYWNESVILVTWDDYGGFYDHVPPPIVRCTNGLFFHPGFRLPLLIISPYAKQGVVLHDLAEQASIPKLVEELWHRSTLASRDLTGRARDAHAGSLLGAFDFQQPPRPALVLRPDGGSGCR